MSPVGKSAAAAGGGWQALRAFAEAAMVGGLADWFAVVALFRHPPGLPIPHTAALRHSPERLAASPRFSKAEADSWLPALHQFLESHPNVALALDTLLADLAADVTERTAPMVEQELKRTIMSWDLDSMMNRLEMQVGDDLQFIRLNGTLVGGLIGLCIFGITRLMGMI